MLTTQASPFKVASYSLDGHKRILEGDLPANILDPTNGVVQLEPKLVDSETLADITSLTSRKSSSVFGDTYGGLLNSALQFSDHTGSVLDAVESSQSAIM